MQSTGRFVPSSPALSQNFLAYDEPFAESGIPIKYWGRRSHWIFFNYRSGPRIPLWKKLQKPIKELSVGAERQNIIIFCDPKYPMYCLESLLRLAREKLRPRVKIYTHSSVLEKSSKLENFCQDFQSPIENSKLQIDFIWKSVGLDPIARLPESREIRGEINLARYLNRLIEAKIPGVLTYEKKGALYASKIDSLLDSIHGILHGIEKRRLDVMKNRKNRYILGDQISLADLILQSHELNLNNR